VAYLRHGTRYATTGGGRTVGSGAGTPQAAIYLSSSTVSESAGVGTVVGTLGVSNATGTPIFTLVDSAGGKFVLNGNDVKVAAALDYETASTHIIEVSVSGTTPAIANFFLVIFVTNVDDTFPIITSTSAVSQDENSELTHFLTADQVVTWSIVGGEDQARFQVNGAVLRWLGNGTKDYENPDDEDANNTYVVIVRATNDYAYFADQTVVVTVVDILEGVPANAVAPVVTGSATVGQLLSCTTGTWSGEPPITYTYQWYADASPISAATNSTYPIISADAGKTLFCRVTATNALGSASANSNTTAAVTTVDTTAPTITSSNTVSNAENSLLAHALTANESVTWSLVGGADEADFEISGSTLLWLGNITRDFELPADADTDNAYVVQVRATDTAANTTDQTITVTVTDVDDTAPTITSSATPSVVENVALAHALTADEAVTWTLIGGFDVALFEISGSTLRWLANTTRDYEAPVDHNTNNQYIVDVRATDTAGNFSDQAMTVTVTNDVADDVPGTEGSPAGLLLAFTKAA
jgi:hypothetical protein